MMLMKSKISDAELDDLLRRAKEKFDKMTPEEQDEMLRKQRESWVRGEMALAKMGLG